MKLSITAIILSAIYMFAMEASFGQQDELNERQNTTDIEIEKRLEYVDITGQSILNGTPRNRSLKEIVGDLTSSKIDIDESNFAVAQRLFFERVEKSRKNYSYATLHEARAEIENPCPTEIPSNDDVFLRRMALQRVGACAPTGDCFNEFRTNYNRYLNTLTSASPFVDSISTTNETGSFVGVTPMTGAASYDDAIYQSFAWQVNAPSSSKIGDPISLKVELVNISPSKASVSCPWEHLRFFYMNSLLIRRVEDQDIVKLTAKGAYNYYHDDNSNKRNEPSAKLDLEAGESFELPDRTFNLVENYDLSEPGEYELTFYTRQYCDKYRLPLANQERQHPRKASIRFTIVP